MPNHIKNKITLLGEMKDIDALIKEFSSTQKAHIRTAHDDSFILKKTDDSFDVLWMNPKTGETHDRGGVIGMGIPDGFEIEITESVFIFPDFKKVVPPPNTDAYKDLPSQDVARESPDWWYNWNVKNWGTKWGGYSYEQTAINEFTFETAWNGVPLIIDKISTSHPSVTIEYSWADEDTGHNCGKSVYRNGLIQVIKPKGGSREAYEIAFELRPDYKNNYELVGDTYEYKEESE